MVENAAVNGLTVFLNISDFHDSFQNFLSSEYTLENLSFYEKVDEFKEILNSGEDEDTSASLRCSVAAISFSRLFDEFLAPGANSELNLNSDLRVELAVLMQEVTENTMDLTEQRAASFLDRLGKALDKAQRNIFQLMTNDMFSRYILSKHYKELLAKVKRENDAPMGKA